MIEGTGALPDYRRSLSIPLTVETHTAPRTPGDPEQSFAAEIVNLQGSLPPGDPDFALLTITAGSDNGLTSLGSVSLADQGDGTFLVDSFFDLSYSIEFEGAPAGALDGLSGTTQGTARLEACGREGAESHSITIVKASESPDATDFNFTGDLGSFSLDVDADDTLTDRRTFNNLAAGTHAVVESSTSGWTLLSIVCDDPDAGTTADATTGQVLIDLDLGEAITCTFRSGQPLFEDGFESGDVSAWSGTIPP